MRRKIDVPSPEDEEGTCYDPDKAREEGLYDELRLFATTGIYGSELGVQTSEVTLSDALMEELMLALDLGVNVLPGDVTKLNLHLRYKYDYGHVEVPVTA